MKKIVRFRYLERNDFLNKVDIKQLIKFLYSGNYVGDNIRKKFETSINNYIKSPYSISVSSGTNAIYLSLKCAGIKKNDEVLVPCLSWLSTFTAISMIGAKAIGVDINTNFAMDLSDLKSKITKKTKAILFVHFSGFATDLTVIKKICENKKIILIEDCAQSFGAFVNKRSTGTFGDFGAFSMNPMKVFSSFGEMGLITVKKKQNINKLEVFRYAGIKNKEKCVSPELNHKSDNLQCFILSRKLSKLKKIIGKRIMIAKEYNDKLHSSIKKPIFKNNFSHIYYSYIIICNNRDKLKKFLEKKGIETKIQHKFLITDHKAFKKYNKNIKFNVADKLKNKILSLPIDENLIKKEINYIIKNVNKFYTNEKK